MVAPRPGSALGCLIRDLHIPWTAKHSPRVRKPLSLPLRSQMPLFCLLHGNGHVIFFPQAPAMSPIHPRAILPPEPMSPDPVGAQPWGCRRFWAFWGDMAE